MTQNEDQKFSLILEKIEELDKKIRPDFPVWMSVKECAAYIGGVSCGTVRALVKSGRIPYRRLPTAEGGKILFSKKLIDLWLYSGELKPTKRVRQNFQELL